MDRPKAALGTEVGTGDLVILDQNCPRFLGGMSNLLVEDFALDRDDQRAVGVRGGVADKADAAGTDQTADLRPATLVLGQDLLQHAHAPQMKLGAAANRVATHLVPRELL